MQNTQVLSPGRMMTPPPPQVPDEQLPKVCNLPVHLSFFVTLSSRLSHPLLHRQQKFEHYKATKTNNRCQVYIRHDTVKVSEVSSSPAAAHVETERNTHLGLHTKVKITRIFFFSWFQLFLDALSLQGTVKPAFGQTVKTGQRKNTSNRFFVSEKNASYPVFGFAQNPPGCPSLVVVTQSRTTRYESQELLTIPPVGTIRPARPQAGENRAA